MIKKSPGTERNQLPLFLCAFWPVCTSHSHPESQGWGFKLDRCWNWNPWCDCQNDTQLVARPCRKNSVLGEGCRDGQWPLRLMFSLQNCEKGQSHPEDSILREVLSRSRVREQKNDTWLCQWVSGCDIWLPTLSLTICVMLAELPNVTKPWFPPLQNGAVLLFLDTNVCFEALMRKY